ncbi:MAG: hypothetical protein IJA60_06695 [Clostridia bacterium]|nr:hypothetical protein [Clostridia bacterium]
MTFSMGELKKFCKENGFTLRAGLFGISKNDSGKCDIYIETPKSGYSVKVIAVGDDAERIYFKKIGGYITVKGKSGETDYMWVHPAFDAKAANQVLLLDHDIAATELSKNCAVTVPAGCKAFGCTVHTPSSFLKLLSNDNG